MSINVQYGYDLECWEKYSLKVPICIDLESQCMILVCGKSGSGKSYSLLYWLGRLLQKYQDEVSIFFLDFKASKDFSFLKPYCKFFSGDDCIRGLREYKENFDYARNHNIKRHILIFDEFASFIIYVTQKYDTPKSKVSKEMLGIVSEILMLGRGVSNGFSLVMIMQRADSNFFEHGSRDNFHVKINIGKPSVESKRMIYGEENIDVSRNYLKGEGILMSDVTGIRYVKFPFIDDIDEWKNNILKCLLSCEEKQIALTKKDSNFL